MIRIRTVHVRLAWAVLSVSSLLFALTERPCQARQATLITAKAFTGGALLGSEVVLLSEASLGLNAGWPYLVGGLAGAGAGAVTGYYIGDGGTTAPAAFMLAGGIALVIPTLLAVLTATHFDPEGYQRDVLPAEEAPEEPLEDDPALDEPATGGVRLGLPNLALGQAFTSDELQKFQVTQAVEYHLCVFCGVF